MADSVLGNLGSKPLGSHEKVIIGVVAVVGGYLIYRHYVSRSTSTTGSQASTTYGSPGSSVPINGATTPLDYAEVSTGIPRGQTTTVPTPTKPKLTLLGTTQRAHNGLQSIAYPAGTGGLYTEDAAGNPVAIANPEVQVPQGTPIYSEEHY